MLGLEELPVARFCEILLYAWRTVNITKRALKHSNNSPVAAIRLRVAYVAAGKQERSNILF